MSGERPYRICTRCVIDTTEPDAVFDAEGRCQHCTAAVAQLPGTWLRGPDGAARLAATAERLKQYGAGRDYDCILGMSGGVDSSYLLHVAATEGLRPLVVHVDAGWNSDAATSNIHRMTSALDIDLVTIVVPWPEMQDVQVAYLRSGVLNQDAPQDHAFFAALYATARQHRIRYVLSGWNFATESILPASWTGNAMDGRQLLAIHKQFGSRPLNEFPVLRYPAYYARHLLAERMRKVTPLNWLPYDKDQARALLMETYGWMDYGGKHEESRWTKYYQGVYLPQRYGFDKRRAHLSSQIVAGQVTRDDALDELSRPAVDPRSERIEKAFVTRKLGLTAETFAELVALPSVDFRSYPNDYVWMSKASRLLRVGGAS
jgi:N-acetyl sugar amidotransferase